MLLTLDLNHCAKAVPVDRYCILRRTTETCQCQGGPLRGTTAYSGHGVWHSRRPARKLQDFEMLTIFPWEIFLESVKVGR